MGDVLADLEGVLRSRSNKYELTAEEELVFQTCKTRAIRDFTVSACVSSAAVWAATRSLTYGQRFNFSVGSALISGMWRFNRALNACIDQVLGLEGSRMQRELANIILTKHWNDESRVQLVRKHFYPEQVFNDLNPDKQFFRWRSKNLYVDSSAAQGTEDSDYHETPDSEPNQLTRSPRGDMIVDPLDCIFGYPETGSEITHFDNGGVLPRRRLRTLKRAHRRHRSRHGETSDHNLSEFKA